MDKIEKYFSEREKEYKKKKSHKNKKDIMNIETSIISEAFNRLIDGFNISGEIAIESFLEKEKKEIIDGVLNTYCGAEKGSKEHRLFRGIIIYKAIGG